MKKIIVPPYNYDEESNTVEDKYICSKCSKLVKEKRRVITGKTKTKRNSLIYYTICFKCKGIKIIKS